LKLAPACHSRKRRRIENAPMALAKEAFAVLN
jgi:hypothetical protein